MRRALGLTDLVLWNIVTVVGLRWVAVAAHTGPGSLSLWVCGGVLFFVPCAFVVARLSKRYPEEGGFYVWTRELFGPWHGFFCAICYFLSTLFYLPTLLLSGLSMAAVGFGLQQDKWIMVSLSLLIVWMMLAANLAGLQIGKWGSDLGGIATVTVGALLMAAGAFAWIHSGFSTPNPGSALIPHWDWQKINFWSQIALGFTGLELGTVMAGEIRGPETTLPRAAWISGAAISAFYVGGTMAVLALVPADRVDIMAGLVQAGQAAGARLGWTGLPLVIAVLMLLSAAGGFSSWSNGNARLPFVIGLDSFLPPAFARLHPRWGTPYIALLTEGIICSVFLIVTTAGETLRAGYQILVDLTTVTTLFPFIYIFAAAWKCRYRTSALGGLAVTVLAIIIAFVPPEGASFWYEAKLVGGCLAVFAVARINFRYALSRQHKLARF
ncbi:MAG: APC family permease, partial [Acidobacteriia bacterium]|nr:APC family permease [Terriglobia bacterium]